MAYDPNDPNQPRRFQPPPLTQPPPIVQIPPPSASVNPQTAPTGIQGIAPPSMQGLPQAPPIVTAPPRVPTAKEAEQTRLEGSKPGSQNVKNPLLKGLAIAGDVASSFFPSAAAVIPGTTLHHQILLRNADKAVAGEQEGALKEAQAGEAVSRGRQAEATAGLAPELAATKQDLADIRREAVERSDATKNRQIDTTDAAKQADRELKMKQNGIDPETGDYLPAEKLSPEAQAKLADHKSVAELREAQTEQAKATAALRDAQARGDGPAAKLAQARIDNAAERTRQQWAALGLHQAQQEMRAHGTEHGIALPGAAQTQTGETVGTANAKNVLPTTGQINKGDLAKSAVDRVADMRKILKDRPDLFGPGNGRQSALQMAIGNQDPDAQTFLAASKYLADHSAALFGGRSQYVTQGLESLNSPKINVKALGAAIDEAEKTAKPFAAAGTRHTIGGPDEITNPKPNGKKAKVYNEKTGQFE